MLCVKFIISGKVQGVWFRASTQQEAHRLDIKGYAKNLANGDVEVIACGTDDAIIALEKWLWHGPDLADVTDVKKEAAKNQSFKDFDIL